MAARAAASAAPLRQFLLALGLGEGGNRERVERRIFQCDTVLSSQITLGGIQRPSACLFLVSSLASIWTVYHHHRKKMRDNNDPASAWADWTVGAGS